MNTAFKVRLTPKVDKAVYSQCLHTLIHLREDLIAELALMHKYGIITVLTFSKYASPVFAQRKPNEKKRLWISGKSTPGLQMIILTILKQSAHCQTQHNTWQGSLFSANLNALRLIIVCRWQINVRWKCSHSILPAEPLPTEDLHKVLADLGLPFGFHVLVFGPSCQCWPMCSIRGW